jgi:hypothetical protein
MTAADLTQKLDDAIKKVTERNKVVQEKKQSGPWGWVVGLVLALVSLVGIGIAMWLASRRAKELAKAKTQIEHANVEQDQRSYEAKREPLLRKRNELLDKLKAKELEIQARTRKLRVAEAEHEARKKKIDSLKAWAEINEA